jgi:hypothetical protein
MNRFFSAVMAGLITTALLATFFLPVVQATWSWEKVLSNEPGFIRAWKYDRHPLYPLGVAGEIAIGLVIAGIVYAVKGPPPKE